jgi:hypothetical protein
MEGMRCSCQLRSVVKGSHGCTVDCKPAMMSEGCMYVIVAALQVCCCYGAIQAG